MDEFEQWWENANTRLTDLPKAQAKFIWDEARNKQAEPVYAYRRRGLNEFCTCDERRYKELSAKPSLFEVAVFYTHPAPAVAQGEADGWHFKFNSGAESFVTNVDAADLIRMGLQAGETCTEYFKKAITAEVGLSKTETTTEAPAVAQPPTEVVRELVEAAQGALQFMEQGCTGCKVELDSDRYPCHTCNRAEKTAKDDLMQPRQELIDLRTALKSAKEHGL